jgi:hypothetical protein
MERVRRHVLENAGRLVGEFVFMDTRPDRGTDVVKETLIRVRRACTEHRAALVLVRFDEVNFWHRHQYLYDYIRDHGIRSEELSPVPMTIGGRQFDPSKHFQAWRRHDALAMESLRRKAGGGLAAALGEVPDRPGRYRELADRLNEQGIKTVRGGLWTAENVRKALKRRTLALSKSGR